MSPRVESWTKFLYRQLPSPRPHPISHLRKQISYKCTDFCDDEVLFSGTAHGGRTELSPDKAPSALMSITVAEELGIFGVKPSKAMDMLTGKRVSLGLSIEAYDREVSCDDGGMAVASPWWREKFLLELLRFLCVNALLACAFSCVRVCLIVSFLFSLSSSFSNNLFSLFPLS